MKTHAHAVLACSLLLVAENNSFSQGFANLDFEQARIIIIPGTSQIATSNAFPGWTTYVGPDIFDTVLYNTISLGFARVSIHDTNSHAFGPTSLQGVYTALLQPEFPTGTPTAGIGQVGTIPSGTESLIFDGIGPFSVSFGGTSLSPVVLSNTPNYTIYGCDISSYAGLTGELRFDGLPTVSGNGSALDNISFSSQFIPEPGTATFFIIGAAALGWRVFRRRQ